MGGWLGLMATVLIASRIAVAAGEGVFDVRAHGAARASRAPRTTYRGKSPVYYTETIYYPILSDAEALSACNHKAYGVLNAGVLCRNFAAHSCYEETT
jgi:hypothetical protein